MDEGSLLAIGWDRILQLYRNNYARHSGQKEEWVIRCYNAPLRLFYTLLLLL